MSKKKGFARKLPQVGACAAPMAELDPIATTVPRLARLVEELKALNLPPRCYGLLYQYAHMRPADRLALNMKTTLDALAVKDVTDTLSDTLTDAEHAALMAVDASTMSLESRRTAHSLLNVEWRRRAVQHFCRIFKDMRTRKGHVLVRKPLD